LILQNLMSSQNSLLSFLFEIAFAVNMSKWKRLEFLHNCDDIHYLFEKIHIVCSLSHSVYSYYDKLIFCNLCLLS
jgi:hypothetical protein